MFLGLFLSTEPALTFLLSTVLSALPAGVTFLMDPSGLLVASSDVSVFVPQGASLDSAFVGAVP
jgi:hypothetical protein